MVITGRRFSVVGMKSNPALMKVRIELHLSKSDCNNKKILKNIRLSCILGFPYSGLDGKSSILKG